MLKMKDDNLQILREKPDIVSSNAPIVSYDLDTHKEINEPTHAVYFLDNWDGEGDKYWVFAYKKDGEFYFYESDSLILTHVGDKILKEIPLTA